MKKTRKARTIWLCYTGGMFDRLFHEEPPKSWCKKVKKIGCEVVKFVEVLGKTKKGKNKYVWSI